MRSNATFYGGKHCQTHSFTELANCMDDGTGRLLGKAAAALVEEAEEPILRKASGSSGSMPGGRRRDLVGERGARRRIGRGARGRHHDAAGQGGAFVSHRRSGACRDSERHWYAA